MLILPSLAKIIGLNEGILLQQIHYWLRSSRHEKGGYKWIYNTYAQWLEQFPFWSEKTLRRTVRRLEEKEIIISTVEFNHSINKTKWYRIDYRTLADHTGLADGTDLIIDEYPLLFQPSLAVKHGLNEAIFLQQLHYWIAYSNKQRDSRLWVVNKYQVWLDQFSFWSVDTLKRTVKSLTDKELIFNTDKYNDSAISNLRWLTINYDMFRKSSEQSDQTSMQNDLSSVQSDQTSTQNDRTYTDNIMSVQSDQSLMQNDQTEENINTSMQNDRSSKQPDLTPMQNDLQAIAELPYSQCKMTVSHIYTETNTEITETTQNKELPDSEIQVNKNYLGQNLFGLLPELQKAKMVEDAFEKSVNLYTSLIDETKTIRRNTKRLADIKELLNLSGESIINEIFDNVKKSDFLLGHAGKFIPSFTFIIKNASKIISGEYESEHESVYYIAQQCSLNKESCEVIDGSYPIKIHCKYCDLFINKDKRQKKTVEEIENEMFEKCKSKPQCVYKQFRLQHPLSYCYKCPKFEPRKEVKTESEMVSKAKICYENCNGCCAVKVMHSEPLDYCKFCPGNEPGPEDGNKIIKADPSDSKSVWKEAYNWASKNDKAISGFIREFEIFSAYSMNDYKNIVK